MLWEWRRPQLALVERGMGEFALVLGPPAAVERWLGGCGAQDVWQAENLGLACWQAPPLASAAASAAVWAPDGRAVGAFSGVVLSDSPVQERLSLRGLRVSTSDHAQLAVLDLALHGPAAVAAWRWQGSIACLNPGQRQALLVRDPLGVGWIGWARQAELQVWSNRGEGTAGWIAVPPGVVLQLAGGKVTAQAMRLQGTAQPFLRDRSAVPGLDGPSVPQDRQALLGEGLGERLRLAVQACVRATGGLSIVPESQGRASVWQRQCSELLTVEQAQPAGAAVWSVQGGAELLGSLVADQGVAGVGVLVAPWPAEVFEPIERCDPLDRAERLWRAQVLPQLLGSDRQWAAQRGRVLVAPHLDPAVIAWLGAFARADRAAWAASQAMP